MSDEVSPEYEPLPYACEDGAVIRERMRQIAYDREVAEREARNQRGREAPSARINTGFMIYQGPPTLI